jgi:deoxyribodipyrimidine photolyase-related protein
MGMSQYADLGSFTSKPYAASGKYIQRMADHCGQCSYDPKETVGEDACPLNSLYWEFMDHHSERLSDNPRMAVILKSWARRDETTKADILSQATTVRSKLLDGIL